MKRIGPQMKLAVSIVSHNPGCCIRFVGVQLHKACANGKNNALGYAPVHRAIAAGLIQAKRLGSRYALTTF